MSKKKHNNKEGKDLLRISFFILFNALVFHEAIASVDKRVKSLRKISSSFQSKLLEEWKKILSDIDYKPVFWLAKEVVESFPTSHVTEKILKGLVDKALDLVASGILLKHDFMGRIYHKLLLITTGKHYATYYTSIPAAWLLANLVFKSPNSQWRFDDIESIKNFRVIDPACGSGTLLSASYMAMKDLYILSCPGQTDLHKFHKVCLEEVFNGWDILDYATHLTLTTLALHNYRSQFSRCNIYTLPAGIGKTGVIHLGSLDYLFRQMSFIGKGFTEPAISKSINTERREQEIYVPEANVVIMNPPFSRSANPNVKFGYSDKKVKNLMNKNLSKLTKQLGMEGIGQAGLGAHFILLGDKLLKEDGRMGIVIPRSMLSGVSWAKIRKRLEEKYEIEYIISNHDPGDSNQGIEPWNWSENTNLAEVLIVAKKTGQTSDKKLLYINLWNKPRNEVESLILVQQVLRLKDSIRKFISEGVWEILRLGSKEVGSMYYVPQQWLNYNWLFPCVFAQPELNCLVVKLLKNIKLPLVRLSQLASEFGVDIKQVKTNFSQTQTQTQFRLLWGQQSSMRTMFLDLDQLGFGKAENGEQSNNLYQRYRSSLLISERPHLSNDCVLAVETQEPVLATAFWEIKLKQQKHLPLVLLWLNSTLGFLFYLSISTNSMGEIFKTKKEQLKELLIPSPDSIDLKSCNQIYRKLAQKGFLPFPEEFAQAAQDNGIRKIIDDFFIKELGLNIALRPYYKMLAQEPILTLCRL